MKKYLLFVLLAGLVLSACAPQAKSLDGSWTLTAYGPEGATMPAAAGDQASITFNADGTISGNSGCNGFGGNYTVDGDQITFSGILSTLMACEEPLMSQEITTFKVLDGTASYKIEGETLTITNNGITLVYTSGGPDSYPSYP